MPPEATDEEREAANQKTKAWNTRPGRMLTFFDGIENKKKIQKKRWVAFEDYPQQPWETKSNETNNNGQTIKNALLAHDLPVNSGNGHGIDGISGNNSTVDKWPLVASSPELATCGRNCWKMDTPLKSSKGRWLIRMRNCRKCGRQVYPITYISDDFHKQLISSKEIYGQYKNATETGFYTQALWPVDES